MEHVTFACRIRDKRKQSGMDQVRFAIQHHISVVLLSKWENGHCLPATFKTRSQAAKALGVTMTELLAQIEKDKAVKGKEPLHG
jgi:transcriptional regulator with XRE-family HTH domain